jgi:Fe-S cluster assembly ATPase SufC
MIEEIKIQNFKSIADLSIPLGRVNVFIGANGSGKSNILEAVAMAAAAAERLRIDLGDLERKGIRIAKPNLMTNSFYGERTSNDIRIGVNGQGQNLQFMLGTIMHDLFSPWHCGMYTPGLPQEETTRFRNYISPFLIYSLSINALRGFTFESKERPLGINGEGLDTLLNYLPKEEMEQIRVIAADYIPWIEDIFFDVGDIYKANGYRLGRSKSTLLFQDRFMQKKNNIFSAENANEGVLQLLCYLTLFISKVTPAFFAIDNIENGLNPRLCRYLIKKIGELAVQNDKQALITTHNPAILDGLNLHDDNLRLFIVTRDDEGHTLIERLKLKPKTEGMPHYKLSEMWMRGIIGGLPENF